MNLGEAHPSLIKKSPCPPICGMAQNDLRYRMPMKVCLLMTDTQETKMRSKKDQVLNSLALFLLEASRMHDGFKLVPQQRDALSQRNFPRKPCSCSPLSLS